MVGSFVRQNVYPAPFVRVPNMPPAPLRKTMLQSSTGERIDAWGYGMETPDRVAMLFFHGNGENLQTMYIAGSFDRFSELPVAFLAIDYPGYGNSTGKPSEDTLRASAAAALQHLRRSGHPVILCGWSLGAAVALRCAADAGNKVAGVVAISPWTSLPDIAGVHFPKWLVRALLAEHYDSLESASRIVVPSLVIHGESDNLIPAAMGKQVAQRLTSSRFVLVDAGHNDIFDRAQTWNELRQFVELVRIK